MRPKIQKKLSDRPVLPARTLELLSMAIADFLQDPESETRFSNLDWMVRITAAKWGGYSMTRRVEWPKRPMPPYAAG